MRILNLAFTASFVAAVMVAASACSKGAPTQQSELSSQNSTMAARALLGTLDISGSLSNGPTRASCQGQTGNFGDANYACVGTCTDTRYDVNCQTVGNKSIACGSASYSWQNGNFTGTQNLSALNWINGRPDGAVALKMAFNGALSGSRIDCAFSATLQFQATVDLPSLTIDCSTFNCSVDGAALDCKDLESKMPVDTCDRI